MASIRSAAASMRRTALGLAAGLVLAAFPMAGPAHAQSMIRDAEIEKTLRDYSNPIFAAANLNPADIRIVIVQDPSLNAFVTNGQRLYLHTGLILAADTPNELKGVIAHETGHIAGGHLARSREAMSQSMTPALISIGLGILAIAAGAPDAGAALISGSQQFALANYVRHTQVQESSADQAALSYLESTGQSAEGLVSFFENFRYQEVMSDARRSPYFRTHPLSSDRIEALRQRAEKASNTRAKDSPADIAAFTMMQAKLIGFLEPPARTFSRYPESDKSLPARYARAVAAYRIPDMARAVREASALTAEQPDNPYFHELLGQILFESGKTAEAVPHDRKALALAPNSPLLQVNLARALAALPGPEGATEAIGLLQKAVSLEPENAFAWRELATAYDKTGQDGMARLASAEQSFVMGDYPRALSFAQRARRSLKEGTASWRRASDIALVAENETRGKRRT